MVQKWEGNKKRPSCKEQVQDEGRSEGKMKCCLSYESKRFHAVLEDLYTTPPIWQVKIEKQLLQWSCINVHQHFMKIVKLIILFHLFLGASSILNWHCFDGPPGAGSEGYQHSRAWHILQTSTTCWIRPR